MADAYLKVKDNGAQGLALTREETDTSVNDLADSAKALELDVYGVSREVIGSKVIAATAGHGIPTSTSVIYLEIPAGQEYSYKVECAEGVAVQYFFYQNGSSNYGYKDVNTEYFVTPQNDVNRVSIYFNDENVTGDGDVTFKVCKIYRKDDSLTERMGDAELDTDSIRENSVSEKVFPPWSTYPDSDLNAAGKKAASTGNEIRRYPVREGETLKIVADRRFQFQYLLDMSGGSDFRVGGTYEPGTYHIKVPDTASALILATSMTDSNASVTRYDRLYEKSLLNDCEPFVVLDEFRLNTYHNNQATSDRANYVSNNIGYCACEAGQSVTVFVEDFENVNDTPVEILFYNAEGTSIQRSSIPAKHLKVGRSVVAPAGAKKVLVRLYPTTTGGLTEQFAVYKNVRAFLSAESGVGIKPLFIRNQFAVPYYYKVNNYIDGKITTIRQYIEAAEGNFDCFVFCTDLHWDKNAKKSPNLINYIKRRLPIPRLFIGGDIEDGINLDALELLRTAYNGSIYFVTGNHEFMNSLVENEVRDNTVNITGDTIWAYLDQGMTDCVIGDASRNYYYVDNTPQKMRYIVLNDFVDGPAYGFEDAQKTWLTGVMNGTPAGYTIVIFVHAVSSIDHETGALSGSYCLSAISEIINGYSGNAYIAAVIAGHSHFDGLGTVVNGTTPIFITTCDKMLPYPGTDDHLSDKRFANTITEQAFDVFVIDKTHKTVNAVRIGCPADNPQGEPLEIRSISYDA